VEPAAVVAAVGAILGAFFSSLYFLRHRYLRASAASVAATALVLAIGLQWVLPGLGSFWLSRSVRDAATQIGGENVRLCSVGYDEPSLVFMLGTKTLLTSAKDAAHFLRTNPGALALVDRRQAQSFLSQARRLDLHIKQVGAFSGLNYSKGRQMLLGLYANR
jgi:hypothetical protein